MADIGFIFGWSPSELWGMSASELLDWREKARARWDRAYGAQGGEA